MGLKNNQVLKGTIAISFSAVLWGFDGVVLTPSLHNLEVSWVVFILHVLPFLLMNLFLFKEYKNLKTFVRQDYIMLFLIAFFGGAIGTISIVKALFLVNFQHLSVVVLLQKLQPIFAILLAAILLKEKIGKNFILWASIAIVASYFLTFGLEIPTISSDETTLQAAFYAILAAFSFGSSTVFSKKLLQNQTFVTATFFRYGFTSLILLIYVVIFGSYTELNNTTNINWLYFSIIGITTGSGAIFIYYYGLRRVKAIVATISELLFPVSAILFDYIFNHSILSPIQMISAVIMVFSIIKLSNHKKA
jgi:drug/metabolite transporter (DMT)-like permease